MTVIIVNQTQNALDSGPLNLATPAEPSMTAAIISSAGNVPS
jgi:hypothetical protein